MTMPLADNPAVTDPRKALTPYQQDALCTIDFYRIVGFKGGYWQAGKKSFKNSTIRKLESLQLLHVRANFITITIAGKLAIDKLKGKIQ